jgi:uncharacterized membrane protein
MNDTVKDASRDLSGEIKLTHIIYGLNVGGLLTGGLTSIAAIIMNYIKRDDMKGTFLESHFDWQIKTFWWSFGLGLLAAILILTLIGAIIGIPLAIGVSIWWIYRIIKGWLKLNDGQPVA